MDEPWASIFFYHSETPLQILPKAWCPWSYILKGNEVGKTIRVSEPRKCLSQSKAHQELFRLKFVIILFKQQVTSILMILQLVGCNEVLCYSLSQSYLVPHSLRRFQPSSARHIGVVLLIQTRIFETKCCMSQALDVSNTAQIALHRAQETRAH